MSKLKKGQEGPGIPQGSENGKKGGAAAVPTATAAPPPKNAGPLSGLGQSTPQSPNTPQTGRQSPTGGSPQAPQSNPGAPNAQGNNPASNPTGSSQNNPTNVKNKSYNDLINNLLTGSSKGSAGKEKKAPAPIINQMNTDNVQEMQNQHNLKSNTNRNNNETPLAGGSMVGKVDNSSQQGSAGGGGALTGSLRNSEEELLKSTFNDNLSGKTKTDEEAIKLNEQKSAKGPDIDKRNPQGQTFLMAVAFNGNTEKVKELIKKGADINAKDFKGESPITLASYHGHLGVVEALLKANAKAEEKNQDGLTPLTISVQYDHVDIVKALIGKKINTNVQFKGMDLLMMASSYGSIKVIKALLILGFDPKKKDYRGRTAVDYAKANGQSRVVKLFAALAKRKATGKIK